MASLNLLFMKLVVVIMSILPHKEICFLNSHCSPASHWDCLQLKHYVQSQGPVAVQLLLILRGHHLILCNRTVNPFFSKEFKILPDNQKSLLVSNSSH